MQRTARVTTEKYEVAMKFVFIGDSGVGKSSLIERICMDRFTEIKSPTVGTDMKFKALKLNGKHVNLSIWDTAGQERYHVMSSSYYRGAHAIILVFDVTNPQSFCHLEQQWLPEVMQYKASKSKVLYMIMGNKVDKNAERLISEEDAVKLAATYNCIYNETSAKTGEGTDDGVLLGMVTTVLDTASENLVPKGSNPKEVDLCKDIKPVTWNRGCC